MALRILRIAHLRGRPPGLAGRMSGARISHSWSERSLGSDEKADTLEDSIEAMMLSRAPIIYLLAQHLVIGRSCSITDSPQRSVGRACEAFSCHYSAYNASSLRHTSCGAALCCACSRYRYHRGTAASPSGRP